MIFSFYIFCTIAWRAQLHFEGTQGRRQKNFHGGATEKTTLPKNSTNKPLSTLSVLYKNPAADAHKGTTPFPAHSTPFQTHHSVSITEPIKWK